MYAAYIWANTFECRTWHPRLSLRLLRCPPEGRDCFGAARQPSYEAGPFASRFTAPGPDATAPAVDPAAAVVNARAQPGGRADAGRQPVPRAEHGRGRARGVRPCPG